MDEGPSATRLTLLVIARRSTAQGITMPRLKVDLARTFEKGQAYVALS